MSNNCNTRDLSAFNRENFIYLLSPVETEVVTAFNLKKGDIVIEPNNFIWKVERVRWRQGEACGSINAVGGPSYYSEDTDNVTILKRTQQE